MDFTIVKNLIELIEKFDSENVNNLYTKDIAGFRNWIYDREAHQRRDEKSDPVWDGKELGRSPESVISTLLVHLNRYAKTILNRLLQVPISAHRMSLYTL